MTEEQIRELQEETKSWRRVAERLEGEKIDLQQQNKQLIEVLELADAYLEKGSYLTAGDVIKDALREVNANEK